MTEPMKTDLEVVERDKIRTEVYKAISDMLDNPGECEIYPTGKCYQRLEDYFYDALTTARKAERETYQIGHKDGYCPHGAKIWIDSCERCAKAIEELGDEH